KILEALKGVDMILHCGDLECLGVLDYLEEVAPLLAVRGYEDPVEEGERLALTTRVVKVEGVSIGMIHDIQWPGPKIQTSPDGADLILPEANGREIMARKFKEPVDIVLYGDTHEEIVTYWDGIMIMNPGSPTYPGKRHKRGALGTLGILEIDGEDVAGRIVELDMAGLVSSI
ncbi:MAG: metallophosphoesterase family protein, partial [Chloroflexota bacterium]|nr:metallophosphoesterase family protein [Chloroflexota bacterium]